MAFTRVRGPGITTDDNYRVGILTATKFVGPMQASGDSDFTNISATGIGTIDGVKIGDPSGIVTASSSSGIVTYYGDASKLTGLTAGQIPNLDGAKITSGTVAAARIDNLAASKITSGTVATARLGSGTANNSVFLRGDNTWATVSSGPATGDTYVKLRSTTGASATGSNTFAGSGAGAALNGSSGDHNTFYGRSAGAANDGGQNNVFLGSNAGVSNVSGHENVAIGQAAYENGTGEKNIAIGRRALQATTSSNSSVGIGYEALKSQTSGGQSVAIGHEAAKTVTGSQNVAIGHVALKLGENTNHNTIVGAFAGDAITSGEGNTALGRNCLSNLQTGTNCIAIGRGASASSTSVSNEITFGDANITKFRIPGLNYYNVAGDVGIGTATPSEKLTVHTASGNTKQVLSSHAGFSELDFVTASTLRADVFANASEFTFTTRTAIPMVFRTNGTNERLRITSDGKVGIGTDNPQGSLHVLRGQDGFRLERDAANPGYLDIAMSHGTPVGANNYGSVYFTLSNTAGDYVWKSASNERMRLLGDSGRLGIGIDNPVSALHVQDSSAAETVILKLRNYKSSTNTKPTLRFEAVTSSNQGANADIQGLAGTDAGGAANANDSGMKFIVRHGGSGTEREAFSIKKDGNIYFPSGQGISFEATADAASNANVAELLDDYEEGRHIVTVTGSSSNPTVNLTMPNLWYVKVGSMVHLSGELRWTTSSHGSGTLRISLPFAAKNLGTGHSFQGTAQTWNIDWKANGTSADYLLSEVGGNTSYMFLRCASNDNLLENALQLGSNVIGSANSGYGIELTVSLTYRAE